MNKKEGLSKGQKNSQLIISRSCKSLSPELESPRNRKSENITLNFRNAALDLNDKRRSFYDFMGYPKITNNLQGRSIDLDVKSQAISLADFMGNSKYLFLKKSGFIKYYYECKSKRECKNSLNKNLDHVDKIREYAIRNPPNNFSNNLSPLIFRIMNKEAGNLKKPKIGRLDEIMSMCDQLYSGSRRSKDVVIGREKVKRKPGQKLTYIDRSSTKVELGIIKE